MQGAGPSESPSVEVLDTPRAGPVALRGGAMRSGAYMLGILLSLISAPLLIRHLGEAEYGHYITVIALVTIVGGLTEGGVNAVALRGYTNSSGEERTRLMANVLGVRIVLTVIGLAAAVAFALLAGYSRDLVLGTLLVGVGMAFQVTQDLIDVSLQATLRFGRVTFVEFLRQLIGVPAVVMAAAFPILTRAQRDDQERFAHAARRMVELAVLIGVWLAVCLELGAGFIIKVLTGHSADPAVGVLRIQGLAVMFTFVAVACAYPLLSLSRQRDLLVANGLGLLAALTLSLILIPPLGAEGGAITTVGAEVTLALASVVALIRARPGLGLKLGVIPVVVLAGGVAVLLGRLIGVSSVVEAVTGALTYIAAVALLGRFPPELGHLMQGLRPAPPANTR